MVETLIHQVNHFDLTLIILEPNAYRHTFNYEVTGEQLADDFKKLRNILNKYPRYKNSLLVGPDITKPKLFNEEPRQFLLDFLIELDRNVLNAITWHQYVETYNNIHKHNNVELLDIILKDKTLLLAIF